MAAATPTHVEGDECMEDIQTRTEELLITERLLISNPVEEKPVRGNFGDNDESQQCVNPPGEKIAQPEHTCNTNVQADECMEDIQTDKEEFRPADPEGEEPVRWDFEDVDERKPRKMEIHVEFNNGMWWQMPYYLSDLILAEWMNGSEQVAFVWDWKDTRKGSFELNVAETSINRYIIDFDIMQQRNTDNGRTRRVEVVSVIRGSNRPL